MYLEADLGRDAGALDPFGQPSDRERCGRGRTASALICDGLKGLPIREF